MHQQTVKLVFENEPRTPILLHIVHLLYRRGIGNLPTFFEAFNDVIALS